ncbi:MAG: cbb3-type cytochrome c oxidase subunit 3 [Bacteroidetes bacterium]|nr:MAG: cbb3-type cytochrome c oxidase subunit 3 [Bacteroidota bacterium]
MFKQFLHGAEGMDQYLIFSMIVFMVFFAGVVAYLFLMKKEDAEELSQIPLNESTTLNDNTHENV